MATRYYRAGLGCEMKEEVVEAGSSSLVWVEVQVVYDLTGNTKADALKAIESVKQYILADNWPPA